MKISERIDIQKMCFCACTICENKMFFFTEGSGLPIELNLQDQHMKILPYTCENIRGEDSDMLVMGNQAIYRLLKNGKEIIEYSLKGIKQYRYVLDEETKRWGNFSFMTFFDHYLYLFPRYVSKTIIIDVNKRKIVSKNDFFEENKKLELDREMLLFRKGCRISDHLIMLFSAKSRDVLVYDLKLHEYESIVFSEKVKGISSICEAKDFVYVYDTDNRLFEWDFQNGIVTYLSEVENVNDENCFGKLVNTDNSVILLPLLGDDIYIYDKKDRDFHIYQEYPKDFAYFGAQNWAKYINEYYTKEYVYFPMRKSRYILRIEKITGKLEWIQPISPLKEAYYISMNMKSFTEGREGSKDLGLEEYIYLIQKGL